MAWWENFVEKHQRDVDRFKQIWYMWEDKEELFCVRENDVWVKVKVLEAVWAVCSKVLTKLTKLWRKGSLSSFEHVVEKKVVWAVFVKFSGFGKGFVVFAKGCLRERDGFSSVLRSFWVFGG